jgi:biofilm protein TabA
MILDTLERAGRYSGLHPAFAAAWDFLRAQPLAALAPGRHEIDGDRLFALVGEDAGRGQVAARLEAHRRYLDIQFVVSGRERIGWRALGECAQPEAPFDEVKDIGFFLDPPKVWVDVPPGHFVIFWPDDAHAPLAGEGPVRKIVLKVAG